MFNALLLEVKKLFQISVYPSFKYLNKRNPRGTFTSKTLLDLNVLSWGRTHHFRLDTCQQKEHVMFKNITSGQIEKPVVDYSATLKMLSKLVEARSSIIVHDFVVDLNLVYMDAINATGRQFYGWKKGVMTMPRATVTIGKLYFFQTACDTRTQEVGAEFVKRGLIPVDPHTLCAFNAADKEFAKTHPNGTQWRDSELDGVLCAGFTEHGNERRVRVDFNGNGWDQGWWLVGVIP